MIFVHIKIGSYMNIIDHNVAILIMIYCSRFIVSSEESHLSILD